jgi:hypothetical protein
VAVCLAGRGGSVFFQNFGADGAALSDPILTTGAALGAEIGPGSTRFAGDAAYLVAGDAAVLPDGLPDPLVIARLAESRDDEALPAPLYLRGADADLPRVGPPVLLD